jgi:hypothetical protein
VLSDHLALVVDVKYVPPSITCKPPADRSWNTLYTPIKQISHPKVVELSRTAVFAIAKFAELAGNCVMNLGHDPDLAVLPPNQKLHDWKDLPMAGGFKVERHSYRIGNSAGGSQFKRQRTRPQDKLLSQDSRLFFQDYLYTFLRLALDLSETKHLHETA